MLELSHGIKIIQLFLFFVMCVRFRPTLRWVVITSCIPALSLIQAGSYESGDFVTHIVRAMDMFSSLQYGIFPVRWAWLLQGGYGYPLFSFMTVLPYYIVCAFHAIHISFVVGLKLYLVGVYVGSAASMWLLTRALFDHHKKKDIIATVSAISYVLAPYTLINLAFRAAAGELMGFALFPLILYAVFEGKRILFTLSLAALLLSHPGITLLGAPWVFLLIIIKKKWSFFYSSLFAFGLSAFYLLPALLEAKFSGQVAYGRTLWTENTIPGFQPISWLFWSPWRYGFLFQGHFGEVAHGIGFAQLGAIVVTIYLCVKKYVHKVDVRIIGALLFLLSIGVFMMLPYSRPIWNMLPLIRHLQFPSRMMFYVVFSTSILLGYVFSLIQLKPQVWKFVLFLCLGWTVLNWSHRTFHPAIDDAFLFNSIPMASFEHERLPEAMPIVLQQPNTLRTSAYVVRSLDAKVDPSRVTPTQRTYVVDSRTSLIFQENTLYFPGWTVHVNGKIQEIQTTKEGIMIVHIPSGKNVIDFQFENTPIRKVANTISMFTLVGAILYFCMQRMVKKS